MPQAYGGAWLPDGRQITFVGAPEPGRDGLDRLDSWYNLSLMQADGSGRRPLVEGFRYPSGVKWSPDGRWFVFSARFEGIVEERGWWPIDVATGRRQVLTRANLGAVACCSHSCRVSMTTSTGTPTPHNAL